MTNTKTRIENSENTVRQPPLRLLYPSPQMDGLDAITDQDGCYTLAAYAYHHPHAMNRALWASLLAAWPRRAQGKRPNYYSDSFAAQAVDRLGASLKDIADVECIALDSARRKVDRGRAAQTTARPTWARIEAPSVIVVAGEEAADLLGMATAETSGLPDDPNDYAWNESLVPDWSGDEQKASEATERASRAARGNAD